MRDLKEKESKLEKDEADWQVKKEEDWKKMTKKFEQEKKDWVEHQNQLRKINGLRNDIIDLNVSGVTEGFTVTKSLFQTFPGSYLDSMVSGGFPLQYKNDRIFINRDP